MKNAPIDNNGKDMATRTNGSSNASNMKIVSMPSAAIIIPPANSNFQRSRANPIRIRNGIAFGKFCKKPIKPGFAPDIQANKNQNEAMAKIIIFKIFDIFSILFFIYAAKNLNVSKAKKAGQTIDFRTPNTPFQKLVAVEIK